MRTPGLNTRREEWKQDLFIILNVFVIPCDSVFPQNSSDLVYLVYNYVPSARHKLEAEWSFANELDGTPVLINGISLSHKNMWPCHKAVSAYHFWPHHRGMWDLGSLIRD